MITMNETEYLNTCEFGPHYENDSQYGTTIQLCSNLPHEYTTHKYNKHSKHLLVFKMSSRHVLKTSSIRLQRNKFSSSKTSCKDVLKTSLRHLPRRLKDVLEDEKLLRWRIIEDVLKTCLEDVCKTFWRQIKCFLKLSVSNKSKCVSNKSGISQTYFWRT